MRLTPSPTGEKYAATEMFLSALNNIATTPNAKNVHQDKAEKTAH
jgi:hypothetical protein